MTSLRWRKDAYGIHLKPSRTALTQSIENFLIPCMRRRIFLLDKEKKTICLNLTQGWGGRGRPVVQAGEPLGSQRLQILNLGKDPCHHSWRPPGCWTKTSTWGKVSSVSCTSLQLEPTKVFSFTSISHLASSGASCLLP